MTTRPLPEPFGLVQVVPPGTGGVRDYAECLQAAWAARGVQSHVLALSKPAAADRGLVPRVAELLGNAGTDLREPRLISLVLHFSAYGYGSRGICFWLLRQLSALRAACGGGLRLVVVFHELCASGPPWQSAFWVAPLQSLVAARLARRADALWTNAEAHARWLRGALGAGASIRVRPVFATIGEPDAPPADTGRLPQAVVFGAEATRRRAFTALQGFEGALQHLGVEEIVEAGHGARCAPPALSIPCRHAGRLERAALHALLQSSRFGVLDYPASLFGKSSVLAAYAAHGCVVLNTRPLTEGGDGLAAGEGYVDLTGLVREDIGQTISLSAMAATSMQWYAAHALPVQADELLALAETAWHRQMRLAAAVA